jgi:hypothetical protein
MSLIPLGFWAASGGADAAAFDLLETVSLTSSASTVTLTGLGAYAATYKHLQIRMSVTSTRSAGDDDFRIRFNGDTGSNYKSHRLIGTGSSVISSTLGATDSIFTGAINAATATADSYSAVVLDILDAFSSDKNTTIRSFGGQTNTSFVYLYSGVYISLDSLSSAVLSCVSGNLSAKSRLSLYGVK